MLHHVVDRKPNYGVDAPNVIRNLSIISGFAIVLSMAFVWFLQDNLRWLGFLLGGIFGITFFICLFEVVYMLFSSKLGKLHERERVLDLVDIRGDEKVMDVGCGRGLLLNGAAQRLKTGKAVGIDIWNLKDQSGNHPDMTRKNAEREGVGEKVEVVSGDARNIPFEEGTFDVVVSSLAIHNIYDAAEREKALGEIYRVLKRGGRFAILDFQHIKAYQLSFVKFGATNVVVIGPHFSMFPPVRIVIGFKPKEF